MMGTLLTLIMLWKQLDIWWIWWIWWYSTQLGVRPEAFEPLWPDFGLQRHFGGSSMIIIPNRGTDFFETCWNHPVRDFHFSVLHIIHTYVYICIHMYLLIDSREHFSLFFFLSDILCWIEMNTILMGPKTSAVSHTGFATAAAVSKVGGEKCWVLTQALSELLRRR